MPPAKKDKPEEKDAVTTGGSFAIPGEMETTEPGKEISVEKNKRPLIYDFEESLLRLGVDLATGMYDKTRFPSTQEVAGLDALCNLYGTLKGYNATR